MRKLLVLIIFFFVPLVLCGCTKNNTENYSSGISTMHTLDNSDGASAISKCQELYQTKKAELVNLENGPCFSNAVIPDWVCDLAHNPRVAEDDNPQNQCPAFRDGKAKHFVELKINDGTLIKSY